MVMGVMCTDGKRLALTLDYTAQFSTVLPLLTGYKRDSCCQVTILQVNFPGRGPLC